MNKKSRFFWIISFVMVNAFLLAGCGSTTGRTTATGSDELDIAIREASDYLNDNIPAQSIIVILNIQSESVALSNYIIDELIANAVNDRNFTVVDRQQLESIRAEQNFQLSGEVDDKLALEIGRFFGAQTIVSGTISSLGNRYRMTVRALEVQTARVQGQFNKNLTAWETIVALMQGGGTTANATVIGGVTSDTARTSAQSAISVYKIGDTGPGGGIVFYDKGYNSSGWRYLEAAPTNMATPLRWASLAFIPPERGGTGNWVRIYGTEETIGSGKANTTLILAIDENAPAAKECVEYINNGKNDWFLPSKDELYEMYKHRTILDMTSGRFWSSTDENDGPNAVCPGFSDTGNFANYWGGSWKDFNECYVRAIRSF